jgi:hypothetical protein
MEAAYYWHLNFYSFYIFSILRTGSACIVKLAAANAFAERQTEAYDQLLELLQKSTAA